MTAAVVFGASGGLGQSLCRTFAGRGFSVAAVSRSPDPQPSDHPSIRAFACDVTDAGRVDEAISKIERDLGPIDTVVHGVGAFSRAPFLEATPEDFDRAWAVSAKGAFLLSQRVLPGMLERGRGTLLLCGATASLRGGPEFAALASSKFALRGLAQSLAREFGPRGVHVAHVVIDGIIWCPWTRERFNVRRKNCLDPDALAAAFADLQAQPSSVWTHELDLRPAGERF